MYIKLVNIGPSPYNRSIWSGLARAFVSLGCKVDVSSYQELQNPGCLLEKPDLLFVVHGGFVPVALVQAYRNAGIPTGVYLLDEPYEVDKSRTWSRYYDWVFSVDRGTVPLHEQEASAMYLPLAYDDTVFGTSGDSIPSDILMLGTPFLARLEILAPLLDKWGGRVTWVGHGWLKYTKLGRHLESFINPESCAKFYRGAKIVINIHRNSVWSHFGELNMEKIEATHLNPRFWEAAACGSFQLCSWREDINTFCPEMKTFRNSDGLDELLDRYLDDSVEREKVAIDTTGAVIGHTYRKRAEEILSVFDLV